MPGLLRRALEIWRRLWLEPEDSSVLDLVRVALGLALFAGYAATVPAVQELYGPEGWFAEPARRLYVDDPWRHSALYFLSSPWQLNAFLGVFLASLAAFTVGWKTGWAKWLVLVGHTSFAYANPLITYGVDSMASSTLLLLCMAPIGGVFGLDAAARRRSAGDAHPAGRAVPPISPRNTTALRLLQVQMALSLLFSAAHKLEGHTWWSGDAVWLALSNPEFTNIPIAWLADHYLLVNALTYGTLLMEIGYVFLIWQRASRPWVLAGVVLLHLGIAAAMGLYFFSSVMIAAHLCFVRREWITRLRAGRLP